MDDQQFTCHQCGREVDDSLTWCPACGVELRPEQAEAIREAADTEMGFETGDLEDDPSRPVGEVRLPPRIRPTPPSRPAPSADPFEARAGTPLPTPFEEPRRSTAAIPLIIILGLLVLAGLGLAVFLVAGSDDGGDAEQVGEIDVNSLTTGQCWEDPADVGGELAEVSEVTAVRCGEPHDNEVFALVDHPLGSDAAYPGEDQIELDAFRYCLEEWDGYVGVPFAESPLDIFYIYPTRESWNADDREIICSLYRLDETPLVGSERDSSLRLRSPAIDPSSTATCTGLADLTLDLAQQSIDYFDTLSEDELAALDVIPEEAIPLVKGESLILARSGDVGCTVADLNALVIAGSGRLSATSEFGRFLVDDITQFGFFTEPGGA